MRVIKRDGTAQRFDRRKIRQAVLGACYAHAPGNVPDVTPVVDYVVECFEGCAEDISVETIQGFIETAMERHGLSEPLMQFKAYRRRRAELRQQRPDPDRNAIRDFVIAMNYAQAGESEEAVIDRYFEMMHRRFPDEATHLACARVWVDSGAILPSMRCLQFGGPGVVRNNARAYNCAFTLMNRLEAFGEVFYTMLSGCGVGYSVQHHHVEQLPVVRAIDPDRAHHYDVEDSIHGWAKSVDRLIRSYFTHGAYLEFNYSHIRPAGSPTSTSNTRAAGHLPLKRLHERIRSFLDQRAGRQLRPIEVFDLTCYIAEAAMKGVRRAATIALFSPDDGEMAAAKTPGQYDWVQAVNRQRAMANISVAFVAADEIKRDVFERYARYARHFGEPGIAWLPHRDVGYNPCGEIGLDPVCPVSGKTGFQFCNLTEVNVAACKNKSDFIYACQAAAYLGTLQASFTAFQPGLREVTEEIAKRSALIGVSLTGMCDNPDLAFDPDLLRKGAHAVRKENALTAERIGIMPASRTTCIKPSGTASLVLGCVASGIHPHHARRYFRRVRCEPSSPVFKLFAEANPHMVEGDCVVFPIKAPDAATISDDLTALEQLERSMLVYENWVRPGTRFGRVTNNVSCTITVGPDEWDELIEALWKNRGRYGAVSMFPRYGDKGIRAPREAVVTEHDERKWRDMIELYRPVAYAGVERAGVLPGCDGEECEL